MSESKHTPGPLEINPDNPTVQQCCLSYGGHSFSGPMRNALKCHLSILRREHPEWEAAPALLAACKEFVRFCESKDRRNDDGICPTKAYKQAKAAIAEAEKGA